MDWVDNYIAIGDWLDSENVAELQEKNIDLVLDARTLFCRKKNNPFEFEPIPEKILRVGDLLVALSDMKAKILIHCIWGIDRTPFVAMIYVSKKYDKSYEEAYEDIKALRPQATYHLDWIKQLQHYGRTQ